MTVDVEDYFQVSAFESIIGVDKWHTFTTRVVANTHRILALFDANNIKATFFVLGWVAERHGDLVREIAARGHEVACHGFSHQLVYRQERATFQQETLRSKAMLEDLVQAPVLGYRAASYSITQQSLWALDVLADAGFDYDSSIFPVRHDLYGIPAAPPHIHRIDLPNNRKLIEFPITSLRMLGSNIPVGGGGYFRLYPYLLSRWFLRQVATSGRPFIFYVHPWELDPHQPRIQGASVLSQFRHYLNLNRCEGRLRRLLQDFQFGPVRDVLHAAHGGDVGSLPLCKYAL